MLDKSVKQTLVVTLLLSFCSIVYELTLANTLSILTGNYIWWHSWTIGFYIAGLGFGALKAGKKLNSWRELFWIEIGLSILGSISVVYVHFLYLVFYSYDYMAYMGGEFYTASYIQNSFYMKVFFFVMAQSVTFLIGLLSGFEIPLLMKILKESTGKDHENKVLGFNYIGTLVGTLFFALFFLPKLDVFWTAIIVAGMNLMICLYIVLQRRVKHSPDVLVPSALVFLFLVFMSFKNDKIVETYLKIRYHAHRIITEDKTQFGTFLEHLNRIKPVERIKSLYQYIDVFEVDEKDGTVETIVTMDSNFQFSTLTEKFYHEGFSHVAMNLVGQRPKNILVLGAGDGFLLRELLKYDEIEKITHIELDPEILKLARRDKFKKINKSSLDNPRVNTIVGDGFFYLRNTDEKFDAIFIDFPYPKNYNLARLYSVEFYTYVKARLKPDGFAVLDTPVFEKKSFDKKKYYGQLIDKPIFTIKDLQNNSIILSTIHYSGFTKYLPYKVGGESFVVMRNSDTPFQFDLDKADLSKIESVTDVQLRAISDQYFPYEIKEKYVNSIFHPTILDAGLSQF
ncbi:MAG: hypothetical protein EP326_14800 [Deltaproteobacteria bacterium]|nr:MAG: hypothetical protein EP326_14800 [Deltaproteobacteria bacterium]TNF31871.1 MAG: hypothetical protein EP319_00885 [Deltaproteobacteria bacterium]